jgi:hypothetical protein
LGPCGTLDVLVDVGVVGVGAGTRGSVVTGMETTAGVLALVEARGADVDGVVEDPGLEETENCVIPEVIVT